MEPILETLNGRRLLEYCSKRVVALHIILKLCTEFEWPVDAVTKIGSSHCMYFLPES